MEGLTLPALQNWSTWLAVPLRRLWGGLLYLPRPGLQKWRFHHGASKWALWWGSQYLRRGLHPRAHMRQPQNPHRSWHAWGEGQSQINGERQGGTAVGRGGGEGVPTDPGPMDAGYWQYSRYLSLLDYWCLIFGLSDDKTCSKLCRGRYHTCICATTFQYDSEHQYINHT